MPRKDKPAPKRKYRKRQALNTRQLRFIEHYLTMSSGTSAAVAAGYSPRSAAYMSSTLLKNPQIRQAIKEARKAQQEIIAKNGAITREEIVERLAAIVRLRPNAFDIKHSEIIKAAETLAKLQGYMVEKHQITGSVENPVRIVLPHNGRDPVPAGSEATPEEIAEANGVDEKGNS